MASNENQSKPIINEEDEACVHALQYATSCMTPMVLNAAIELDIFGIIDRAGLGAQISSSQIASHLSTKNPQVVCMLDRMLRLFVTHSFLTCSIHTLEDGSAERRYGLAAPSRFLLGNEDEGSLASLVALGSHQVTVGTWFHTKEAIIEGGRQFKKLHGVSTFEYMANDPAFNKIANTGMASVSRIIMRKVLEKYTGFEGLTSLVDVGGGSGITLSMIIYKYPSINGINYDLPHVLQRAPSYPGVEHAEGDMFLSVPKGDAILIKDILHNWSDEDCIKLLKNCYEALPDNGKAIIITIMEKREAKKKLKSCVRNLDFQNLQLFALLMKFGMSLNAINNVS